jgi:uncharacterized protein (TIGR00266 family)
MDYQIEGNPDYGQFTVGLGPDERFIAEGGSMAWMSDGMGVKARLIGGLLKALVRKMVAGESLFVGEYSHPTGGSATFSPARPGTVLQRTLNGDSLMLTAGSFMAATPDVKISTRFGGLRGIFSGEGAFFIECSGTGELFFNSFGAIIEKEVEGSLIVDTGNVVAWEPSLSYSIKGVGGLKSTVLSGEGLVMNFNGSGKIYLQTRTMDGLSGWLTPFGN